MTDLDDLLSKWPMRASTQLEADEAAERVVAAIEASPASTQPNETILNAPLPKTNEDEQTPPRSLRPGLASPGMGVESKMSKDRTRERTSFQELAKMATTPPPPSSAATGSGPNRSSSMPSPASISGPSSVSGGVGVVRGEESSSTDSGIVDLKAIATADPSGEQRAQQTPLASSGLFEDESAPAKPAIESSAAEKLASTPPPSTSVPAVAQAAAAAAPSAKKSLEEKKSGGGAVIAIGALFVAASIAAGVVLFVRSHHQAVAVTPTTVATGALAANTAKTQTTTPAASLAQADTTTELPDTDTTTDTAQTGGRPRLHGGRATPGPNANGGGTTAPDVAPTGTIDPKLIANVPTGAGGGNSGDLNDAMKTAAGGGTGLGAGGGGGGGGGQAAGNVAQRPSQGQVAGAIGSVMQSAKGCLAADEPMSRATVTFQSDGTVKSVSVSGFAAGKPQEACIKGALSKARVDPFAEATYPVPVTIRSN